jgi:hypothetical protein
VKPADVNGESASLATSYKFIAQGKGLSARCLLTWEPSGDVASAMSMLELVLGQEKPLCGEAILRAPAVVRSRSPVLPVMKAVFGDPACGVDLLLMRDPYGG